MTTRTQRQRALLAHVRLGLSAPLPLLSAFDTHHAQTLNLLDALQPGDFPARRVGRLRLAAQFGLLDARCIPLEMIKANGQPDLKLIDDLPVRREKARPDDPEGYGHSYPEIPEYDAIPGVVEALSGPTDRVLYLRSLGLVLEDGSAARLNDRIRGVQRALWLFHLWHGDAVSALRFRRKKRKAGDVFVVNPRWYHPDDVARYRALAWAMHADGTRHADSCAYLRALTLAWSAHSDDREHAGAQTLSAVEAILDALTGVAA